MATRTTRAWQRNQRFRSTTNSTATTRIFSSSLFGNNTNNNNVVVSSFHDKIKTTPPFHFLPMSTSSIFSSKEDSFPKSQEELKKLVPHAETPLLEKSDKTIFQRLYDRYSFKQQTNRILVAESFLQAAIHQASNPRWFRPKSQNGANLPKSDFRTCHALITMHIWMLHKRLLADNTDPYMALLIQEEVFDILWTDTQNRMRLHGVGEFVLSKHLKTVQKYTFMHCVHYDQCYTTHLLDQPTQRLEELKYLVKKHIMLTNTGTSSNNSTGPTNTATGTDTQQDDDNEDDDFKAEQIAWYIETQYQNIVHDWPESWYELGRVAWVDLPNFTNEPQQVQEDDNDDDDELPSPWRANLANDGTYYYWNTETRQATWERPTKTK